MKVFTRGSGEVAGLDEAVEVLSHYSDLEGRGEVWVTKNKQYGNKDPLVVIKGPIQSFVELETMYLGVLSHAISQANGLETPIRFVRKSNILPFPDLPYHAKRQP